MKPLEAARRFKPDRVYHITSAWEDLRSIEMEHEVPILHDYYLFHLSDGAGIAIRFDPEKLDGVAVLYDRQGKTRYRQSVVDLFTMPPDAMTEAQKMLALYISSITWYIAAQVSDRGEPDTPGQGLITYERRGDSMRYDRLTSVNHGNSRPRDMSNAKRLHEVRGHWRRLANGTRTWVRAHERGDESLGRIHSCKEI